MQRMIFFVIIPLLFVLRVAGQNQPLESPRQLLSEIAKSKPDTNRISLQLKLGSYYLFKPGEFKNDLDSAINFFNQAARLSNQLHEVAWQYRTLGLIGNYYVEAGDLERCKQCFMRVIDYYRQTGNLGKEVDALHRLGDLYSNIGKNDHQDERIGYYRQACSLCLQNRDSLNAIRNLNSIAVVHKEQQKYVEAENEFFQVIKGYQKLNSTLDEINALKDIADMHLKQQKYVEAENELLQVSKGYHKLNRIRDEMNTLKDLADIHLGQREYIQAESELLQVIKVYKQPVDLMHAYDLLGAVYAEQAEYSKSLFYALKTIRMMQLSKDSTWAGYFYYRLYAIYRDLNMPALSVQWAKKDLELYIRSGDRHQFIIPLGFIVRGLLNQGKADSALTFILHMKAILKTSDLGDLAHMERYIGDCYIALGKYTVAEKNYLEMIRLVNQLKASENKNHDPKNWMSGEYKAAGDFYIKMGNYSKARAYLLLGIVGAEHEKSISNLKNMHLSLFKADSALGYYRSAIVHLQQNMRIKDSTFNVTKNRQIEELQIKYQTEEEDKNLKLAQNKAKLEQVQLDRSQNTRNWIIAGSGLLLVIAGLLYRQSRLRKKNNKLITHQNKLITHKNEQLQNLVTEKEWLLKEVHHRVKNNLHSVICLLEAQAAYLENDALQAIANSQHRIYTMSLIHQKLYQSDDVKTIDMAVYIPELVQYLRDSFYVSSQIYFNVSIEPIQLNASQAIPLALIVNEALTNSIKYAFPVGRNGEIMISLSDTGSGYKMEIADNGIGLDRKMMAGGKGSLGLELMKGLTKEIRGEIKIESSNGVRVTIVFEHDLLHDMSQLQSEYFESV